MLIRRLCNLSAGKHKVRDKKRMRKQRLWNSHRKKQNWHRDV
jgi:hypothetical protein